MGCMEQHPRSPCSTAPWRRAPHLAHLWGAGVGASRVVARMVVRLPTGGSTVLLGGGAPLMLCSRLPMPTQKAMARPASSPTTAPCNGREGRCSPPTGLRVPQPPRHCPSAGSVLPAGQGDAHHRVGAGEEHAQAEKPQERAPHHAEDADGCLRGHGPQHQPVAPARSWHWPPTGWVPELGGPTPPSLPAARGPAWRTRKPSPGRAIHNQKLGKGVGGHGGAGDPPLPASVPPLCHPTTHPAAWRAAWPVILTARGSGAGPGPPSSLWPAS